MTIALIAPGEHHVLVFLCQIVVILAVARGLGWLLGRVGQPAVVGELLAGIVLGPSILGRASPDVSRWLFPEDAVQGAMLYGLAWLGLMLLLAATGFESDLTVLRRLGRPAILVSAGSLVVPLAGGFLLGLLVPASLRGTGSSAVSFACFLGVALGISSLPVVAKVLGELGVVRRNVGQLILAAAMANDVIGWVLLGLVAGLAGSGGFDGIQLLVRCGGVILFVFGALRWGQRLVDRSLRLVSSSRSVLTGPATAVIGIVLGAGALTQWMGVEAVLGAFIAGVIVGRSRWRDERVVSLIEAVGTGILAPLFFATAGLRVDLGIFTRGSVVFWTVAVVLVASVTKFAGAIFGARAGGLPAREQLALGVALNARGALEIVVATVGLSIGVLNDDSYGAIVVMAIVTSLAAAPLLRRVLSGWAGTTEEQERLRSEQAARRRLIVAARPPMLLTRGQPPSLLAAQLLDLAWDPGVPVTVWSTCERSALAPVIDTLAERDLRVLHRDDGGAGILAEADRGHGAIVVGVSDRPDGTQFSPMVEAILAGATVPVVLVRTERISGQPLPAAFAKALVPVTGSVPSRAGLEIATGVAARLGTELVLAHLDPAPVLPLPFGRHPPVSPLGVAEPMLRSASRAVMEAGASSVTAIARTVEAVPAELVRLTVEHDIDLLVLGATRRETGEGSYLGPIATHALAVCPCTVAIVVTPPGWVGWHQH